MMNTLELRKDFHNLIDQIENEALLRRLYDIFKTRSQIRDGQLWSRLNEQEQEELLKAFEESEDPDHLLDYDEVKKKHEKWL